MGALHNLNQPTKWIYLPQGIGRSVSTLQHCIDSGVLQLSCAGHRRFWSPSRADTPPFEGTLPPGPAATATSLSWIVMAAWRPVSNYANVQSNRTFEITGGAAQAVNAIVKVLRG